MLRQISSLFLLILTVVLLILSFPNYEVSFLAWVALVPLFFLIARSSARNAFFLSFFAGLFFFAGLLSWLVHVTTLGYVVLIVYLALYFGLFGFITNLSLGKLRVHRLGFLSFLFFPSVWVSLEFIRGFLFTGFPWGVLGYTQYKDPIVIQIADITGAHGVSFIIVMVNFMIFACLTALMRKKAPVRALRFQVLVSIAIVAAVIAYGNSELNRSDITTGARISVVQGNIEQARKWDPYYQDFILERYEALTREAAGEEADLIVWPETSVPGFLEEKEISGRIGRIAKTARIPLLVGAVTSAAEEDGEHFFNSAVLISPEGEIEEKYDKVHLVPLGEYIPFEQYFPSFRNFIDVPIGDYTAGEKLTVFTLRPSNGKPLKYSTLICFEDIFPGLVRKFALEGANVMINVTNDAWFQESSEQLQHAQASVFRAIENRVSVVRAANTGLSCYISPKGVIEGSIRDENTGRMYIQGCKTFDIAVSNKYTFYSRFGEMLPYFCVLLFLVMFFWLTFES